MTHRVSRCILTFGILALLSAALALIATAGALAQEPARAASAAEPPAPQAPLVITADGAPFRGNLVGAAMEPAWLFRFAGPDGPREVPTVELATWGGFVEPNGAAQIVLAGGGVIVADAPRIEGEQLIGSSRLLHNVKVPLKLIAGIIFQPPADRAKYDHLLARVLSLAGQSDRVILDNGDELTGSIAALDGAKLRLQSDAGPLDLEQGKLAAVLFNPILIDKPQPGGLRVLVGFSDGSRAAALSVVADKTSAQLKLAGGVDLVSLTGAIVALQPLGGRIVYLSDLKPSSYRHLPFLDLSWPYRADSSVLGSLLRAGGGLYLKGLGMHSPSRITYDLDGEYKRFDADVAIDAETGPRGSVIFRVFTDDGSGSWQQRAKSEIVRGGEAPVPISVDLAGARRISLLVDFADHGDEQDHADWLGARLVR